MKLKYSEKKCSLILKTVDQPKNKHIWTVDRDIESESFANSIQTCIRRFAPFVYLFKCNHFYSSSCFAQPEAGQKVPHLSFNNDLIDPSD